MPLVIALTGGIGSGKSSVAAMLKELGAAIIDTDEIAHRLTAAGQSGARAINEQFGAAYLRGDGALDRERMRERVFSDPQARQKLEAILHPMIRAEVNAEMSAEMSSTVKRARAPYIVIVVPLLIETGAYRDLARRILVVDCSEEQQIARVMQRSGLTADTVRTMIASQVSRSERLKHADDIVRNDTDLVALRAGVAALHHHYLELAKNQADPGQSR
jgi:dephospho-CoA kinase